MLSLLLVFACDKDRFLTEEALLTLDLDGDGVSVVEGDCNDQDPAVHPGAEELCDGVNNDCDEEVDEGVGSLWFLDADEDGWGADEVSAWSCQQPAGYVIDGGDCEDGDPSRHPQASEVCNGLDDDCDGTEDEEVLPTWYPDEDQDGYGDGSAEGVPACEQPDGTVDNDFDCDDQDERRNALAPDICDEVDNDCDGELDEDPDRVWTLDSDQDGFGATGSEVAACAPPQDHSFYGGDCDDVDPSVSPAAQELCDGLDNDCDGQVDPTTSLDAPLWYQDSDGDGSGDAAVSAPACEQPLGWVSDADDCDDGDASIQPGATEYCDGVDNDCDAVIDEDDAFDAATWYADVDQDGYGDAANTTGACSQPSGFVSDDSDCDDSRADDHPGADESCDGRDNDCDGDTDESGAIDEFDWYLDADGDGYGDSSLRTTACDQPAGYVSDSTDCDDAEATTNPDAVETCDSVDNDCDGSTDEDDAADATTWAADADGDGYGAASSGTTVSCDQPSGYAEDDDCDDGDSTINPGATEVCDDGVDDDCDGTPDDGCPEEHCGALSSDETWSSLVDHVLTCSVTVQGGATLTIEDGATLLFDAGTELRIGQNSSSTGTLEADGSSSGITLTSNQSSPAAGDWDRVFFSSHASSASTFTGVTVEYAGDNSTGAVQVAASIDIEDCVIADSASAGIWVDSNGTAAVSGCSISGSADEGVMVVGALSTTGGPTFVDNTITTSGTSPIVVPPNYVGQIDASNTLTGNGQDEVVVTSGTISRDNTLALLDVDFVVEGDVHVLGSNIPVLTVEDGVTLAFDPGAGLYVGVSNSAYGALDADGSASGILLTSSEASPGAGDWDGLTLGNGFYPGDSTLVGLTIEYAGYTGYGGLISQNSDALVEDSVIQDNDVAGVYLVAGDIELNGCTIQDNLGDGVTGSGTLGGEASFANNTVTGNTGYPVVLGPDGIGDLDDSSSYTGNGSDLIYISQGDGAVDADASWQALDVDYYVSQSLMVGGLDSPVLTLEDGVTIQIAANQGLSTGTSGSARYGGLVVDGGTTGVTLTSAESSPAALGLEEAVTMTLVAGVGTGVAAAAAAAASAASSASAASA